MRSPEHRSATSRLAMFPLAYLAALQPYSWGVVLPDCSASEDQIIGFQEVRTPLNSNITLWRHTRTQVISPGGKEPIMSIEPGPGCSR